MRWAQVALIPILWVGVAAGAGAQNAAPLPEGNAYVRGVLTGARPQDGAINDYTYDLEETRENLDKNGKTTSRESLAYEVYFVGGRPVRRLVSRNGVPLPTREQAEVDKKAAARAAAITGGRTVNEQPGIRLSSLLNSFEFKTVGREEREGRKTLVFEFEPRKTQDSKASSDRASDAVTRILTGRVHIDEADRRVVELDARNAAGQRARVAAGVNLGRFELRMEFASVENQVWLPRKVVTLATGRAFLFKTFRVRQTTRYSNYRRFKVQTEEKTVPR